MLEALETGESAYQPRSVAATEPVIRDTDQRTMNRHEDYPYGGSVISSGRPSMGPATQLSVRLSTYRRAGSAAQVTLCSDRAPIPSATSVAIRPDPGAHPAIGVSRECYQVA